MESTYLPQEISKILAFKKIEKLHLIITLSFFLSFLATTTVCGQELTSYAATGRGGVATTFATDYQAIGINPANLAIRKSFRDPKITFGFLEGNIGFFAEKITFGQVLKSYFPKTFNNGSNYQLSYAEKAKTASDLTNTPLSTNINATLFGFHINSEKYGGFAFSIRDKLDFYSKTNATISEILFLGQNASYFTSLLLSNGQTISNSPDLSEEVRNQVVFGFRPENEALSYGKVMNNSTIQMLWTREYNFAYGKKIFDSYNVQIFAGIGGRYISGISLIDLEAQNNEFVGETIALSPSFPVEGFDIPSPTNLGYQPKKGFARFALPKPIGHGYGIDIGLNIVIKRNLYLGASLINYGKMTWTGNVYTLTDGILAQTQGSGFDNYNFIEFSPETFQLGGEGSALSWEGSSEFEDELPTMIRAGASYEFFKTAHLGFDVIIPLNPEAPGSLADNLYAIGGDLHLNKFFTISSGISTGGNQDFNINIPIGVIYHGRKRHYEAGISTQDISSFIGDIEGGGNTISFALGFLRFKF
ncbi:hypothetical protein Fleli_3103 [Bernardetia litoralis DSM 6794]|uniref:DUF5723 domain-containing protein n=1 Tax=Bernardetia litoralis (strain ATCC 23117 / DSM 6794 / NBRC 15988 / NCIMB 1366 / Fx l1 / Sio-4) TaxID=880071 RepID=I4ANA8_BERLS|nr:DUF5723 family protein [Bernardetia litoralis]AFM05443.1 hypothetical protein Fleli_3103 [Bernardetia litoralis DSM 6794]